MDTSEALCLDSSTDSTPLLNDLSRRLVPQQVSAKLVERIRDLVKTAVEGCRYAQAIQLLSKGLKIHKRVDLLVDRAHIQLKCRR